MNIEQFIKEKPWIAMAIVVIITLIACVWWHSTTSTFNGPALTNTQPTEHVVASATFAGANERALKDRITVETKGSLGGMTLDDLELETVLARQNYL